MAKDALGHGSDARAAAALAQGHPKSTPLFAIQSASAKGGWNTEKLVDFSKMSKNPAAKAERIAMRMRTDNRTRNVPGDRAIFRVK